MASRLSLCQTLCDSDLTNRVGSACGVAGSHNFCGNPASAGAKFGQNMGKTSELSLYIVHPDLIGKMVDGGTFPGIFTHPSTIDHVENIFYGF